MTPHSRRNSISSTLGMACVTILSALGCLLLCDGGPLHAQVQTAEQHYQNGVASLEAQKYDDALAAFNAALGLQPNHEQAYRKRMEAYHKKIVSLRNAGQYGEVVSVGQSALGTAIRPDDLEARSEILIQIGFAYQEVGNSALALEALPKGLELAQKTNQRSLQAEALNGMGVAYRMTSQHQKAIACLEQAAELYRTLPDKAGEGRALVNIGDVYTELSEIDKAFTYFEQALRLSREAGSHRNEAKTLSSMATAYAFQGNYPKSLELDKTVLGIYRELGDRDGEAGQLGNIAASYIELGDYWQGLQYSQQALAITAELQDKYVLQLQLANLGNVYYLLGDHARALDSFQRSRRIAQDIGDVQNQAIQIGSIGSVQNELGQTDEALKNFELAVGMFEQLGDKRGQAVFSANIATIHTLTRRYAEALPKLARALQLHQEIENPYGVAETHNGLGALHLKTGDHVKARQAHEKALAMGQQLQAAKIVWEAQYGLAQAAKHEGRLAESKAFYLQAIASVEAVRAQLPVAEQRGYFLANRTEIYKGLIHLLYHMEQRERMGTSAAEAFYYSEKAKARALLDLLTEAKIDLDRRLTIAQREKQDASWQRIAALQTKLSQAELTLEERKIAEEELVQAERSLQDLVLEIRRQDPLHAQIKYPEPLSQAEVRQKILDDDELILAYSLGEEQSYLWAITSGRHFFFQLPGEGEIEKAANAYLPFVNDKRMISTAHLVRSRELYDLILMPADSLVKNTRKIIISADGILHAVPFEALVMPTRDRPPKYLIQHAEITYAPSLTVLSLLNAGSKTSSSQSGRLLAFADPYFGVNESPQTPSKNRGEADSLTLRGLYEQFGARFPRLIYSGTEIDSIARFFPANMQTIHRRQEAREERVKQDDLQRYAILHFATHGVLDEQHPERSCIVLALDEEPSEDGFVQMGEIYNLKLDADLVVLSACQTLQGKLVKGEGLVSLGRAFLYAGARSVLGTLWPVADDRSTPGLMGRFYGYLQKGKTRGQALRLAKLDLIGGNTASHRHPFYWAAFVLTGNVK